MCFFFLLKVKSCSLSFAISILLIRTVLTSSQWGLKKTDHIRVRHTHTHDVAKMCQFSISIYPKIPCLQLCRVTLRLSVCQTWKNDFWRPITYEHSSQTSGRSLSHWHVAKSEEKRNIKNLATNFMRLWILDVSREDSLFKIND